MKLGLVALNIHKAHLLQQVVKLTNRIAPMVVHVLAISGEGVAVQRQHAAHPDVLIFTKLTHRLDDVIKARALDNQLPARLQHPLPLKQYLRQVFSREVLNDVDCVNFVCVVIVKRQVSNVRLYVGFYLAVVVRKVDIDVAFPVFFSASKIESNSASHCAATTSGACRFLTFSCASVSFCFASC